MSNTKEIIVNGKAVLGIELGSTRIKAVLTGENSLPIASGTHEWENRLEDGIWTYTLEDIWTGLADSYTRRTYEWKKRSIIHRWMERISKWAEICIRLI